MKSKSQMQRREFVGGTLAAGAAGVIASGSHVRAGTFNKNECRRCDFDGLVGDTFRLQGNKAFQTRTTDRPAVMLTEVGEQPIAQHDARSGREGRGLRSEPFSLHFAAKAGTNLSQGTYRVSHPALGDLDLFLVPEVKDDNSKLEHYVVCFS